MNQMTGALLGFGVGLGLILIWAGWSGTHLTWTRPAAPRTRPQRFWHLRGRREKALAAAGLTAGVLVATLSGWLVALPLLPVLAVLLPRLMASPQMTSIDRLEALEEWARNLSSLVGHTALGTAIQATRTSTPEAIAAENGRLIARLNARRPLPEALRLWAEEINDETGDYLASALIQASSTRSAGLSHTLEQIAIDVAREVRARREIATEQRRSFTVARLIVIIALLSITGLVVFSPMGEFYRSLPGQVVLAGFAAVYLSGLAWLQRLATPDAGVRILAPESDRHDLEHADAVLTQGGVQA